MRFFFSEVSMRPSQYSFSVSFALPLHTLMCNGRISAMKVRGKLIWNPKGYGFVESKGLSEDVFIPPEGLNSALDGDLVEVDVYRDRKGLRGRVSSVIERSRLSISGRYIKLRKFGVLE